MDGYLEIKEVQPLRTFRGHTNSVESVVASPSGTQMASGSHDKLIKMWDIEKGTALLTMSGHKQGIWSLDFSKDGKTLLSGSCDSTLCIWDSKSGKANKVMNGHLNKVYLAKYNQNDMLIASGGDSQLIVWDMRKGAILASIKKQSKNQIVYGVEWSKNGQFLATSQTGGLVNLYETAKFGLQTTNGLQIPQTKAYSIDLNFSSAIFRNRIFVSSSQKNVQEYRFEKGQDLKLVREWTAHLDGVKSVKINPELPEIVTSGRDGSVYQWQLRERGNLMRRSFVGHSDNVSQTSFSKSGLLTGSWDQTVNLYKY